MKRTLVLFAILLMSCVTEPEYTEENCNPEIFCGQALTCIDGLVYPTTCGPDNCDESIDTCD